MIETSPSASRPPHTQPDSDTESTYSSSASCANNVTANQARAHRYVPRKRKHKILGLKSQVQRGNDPYDYEQKYPEDEPYKEMGPMARIWKVFLDECTKFDAEMTEDWKDALDVLLVFAGLFSAVVTTFVSQTSQKLQRDFTEVTAHKMDEMTKLLRVVIAGNNITDVPPSSLSVSTKFVPERSDLWVNGLWFTSLALSLTTALLAVLTKQWIHQYMSVPSGTPRDRSRIRQFRFNSLERWRVPVIIGLLPVLMHVSLGVFFAGLIVYLRSLDTPMSGIVTSVAVIGFAAYFGTNLLPLFKPDCPYKTPLTLYSQSATVFLWSVCKRLLQTMKTSPKSDPEESDAGSNAESSAEADAESESEPDANDEVKTALSLREIEKEMVNRTAADIEAQCLSWLFDISSNSSVQRVVAQAFSVLPLKSVQPIGKKIPGIRTFIRSVLVLPEHQTEESHRTYERLLRALVKFAPDGHLPAIIQLPPMSNSLAVLIDPNHHHDASTLLCEQILNPTIKLDVLSWALILRNALEGDTNWLGIHRTDYEVWTSLIAQTMTHHRCSDDCNNCGRAIPTLIKISVPFRSRTGRRFWFEILDLPGTEVPATFISAITEYMSPSFFELLSTLSFPSSSSSLKSFPELPPDICFQLDLMRSRYVQDGLRSGYIMSDLVEMVVYHLGLPKDLDNPLKQHPTIIHAAFRALCDIVHSDSFVSNSMTFNVKRDIVHALFRTLLENPGLVQAFVDWLSPSMITRICQIAFVDSALQDFPSPLITEILGYDCGAGSPRGAFIATAYAYLTRRNWLHEIKDGLLGSLKGGPDVPIPYTHAYPFLASQYVDGLPTLQSADPAVYEETLQYIREPHNTIVLSKLLLFADCDRRQSLLKLAWLVGRPHWMTCCEVLQSVLCADEGAQLYRYHAGRAHGKHPFRNGVVISYGTYADLESLLLVSMTFDSVQPQVLRSANGLTPVSGFHEFLTKWRVRNRVVVDERGRKEIV